MRRKKERSKQGQTNKQGKATQHTQGSHFSELPQVGLEPTTLYTLDRALYQLSYRGSSAGWAQISHLIVHLMNRLTINSACTRRPADSLTGSGLRSRCQWSIATARCIQYNKFLTKCRDLDTWHRCSFRA